MKLTIMSHTLLFFRLIGLLTVTLSCQVQAGGPRPIDQPFDLSRDTVTAFYESICKRIDALPKNKLPASIEILQKKLQQVEAMPYAKSPLMLTTLDELACAHERSGQISKTRAAFERALFLSEKNYGPDHLRTATSLGHLAIFFVRQNRERDALAFSERALKITENHFGFDYALLVRSMNSLTLLYSQLGRHTDSLALGQRTLRIAQEQFGNEHRITTKVLFNIGWVYFKQFDYGNAQDFFVRVLKIRDKQLPTFSNDVEFDEAIKYAEILNSLGTLHFAKEEYVDATSYFRSTAALYEQSSATSFQEALALNKQALSAFLADGKPDHELDIYRAALPQEKTLDLRSSILAASFSSLGFIFHERGKYITAGGFYKNALDMTEASGGHPLQVATLLTAFCDVHLKLENIEKAAEIGLRALAIRENNLGPQHPATAITLSRLAQVRQKQGQYLEAEAMNQRALAIYENTFGTESFKLVGILKSMASLYTDMKQPSLEQALTNRLLAIEKIEVKK